MVRTMQTDRASRTRVQIRTRTNFDLTPAALPALFALAGNEATPTPADAPPPAPPIPPPQTPVAAPVPRHQRLDMSFCCLFNGCSDVFTTKRELADHHLYCHQRLPPGVAFDKERKRLAKMLRKQDFQYKEAVSFLRRQLRDTKASRSDFRSWIIPALEEFDLNQ